MSIYEASNAFTKQQFIEFCEMLYNKGRMDGAMLVDDLPWIRNRLADWPHDMMDEIE